MLLGVLFNFLTYGHLVFNMIKIGSFFRFIIVNVLLYFVSIVLIKYLIKLKLSVQVSGFISLSSVAVLSFILNKYFSFYSKLHSENA